MRQFRLNCIVLIIAMNALMCVLAEEELFTDQYDYIDVRAILQDKNEREAYYNCFMEIAPCQTPEQTTLTGISVLPNSFLRFFCQYKINILLINNIKISIVFGQYKKVTLKYLCSCFFNL